MYISFIFGAMFTFFGSALMLNDSREEGVYKVHVQYGPLTVSFL